MTGGSVDDGLDFTAAGIGGDFQEVWDGRGILGEGLVEHVQGFLGHVGDFILGNIGEPGGHGYTAEEDLVAVIGAQAVKLPPRVVFRITAVQDFALAEEFPLGEPLAER